VTVLEGTFTINGAIASGDGVGLNRAGGVVLPLRVAPAGTFSANNRSQRVGGLDGAGRVSGGTSGTPGTMTIVRDNSAVSEFSGTFTASTMNLVKEGNGLQILSGTLSNTGTTTITGGTLQVDGTLAAGGGLVTIESGGTLGGNGSVLRAVASAGAIAPGASVGSLTVESLSLDSGSMLNWEVGDAGTDLLTVTGLLNLTGPTTLNLTESGTLAEGTYTLINFGSFAGDLSSIDFGSTPAGLSYALGFGESNSIDLQVSASAVPEPAGMALLGLGAALAAGRRRRQM
jgi:fibronectin-binding autotransporter adhesin